MAWPRKARSSETEEETGNQKQSSQRGNFSISTARAGHVSHRRQAQQMQKENQKTFTSAGVIDGSHQ